MTRSVRVFDQVENDQCTPVQINRGGRKGLGEGVFSPAALLSMPSRSLMKPSPWGHVAEWLRSGLQIRVRGFDSLRGLQISRNVGFLTARRACARLEGCLPFAQASFSCSQVSSSFIPTLRKAA